jgi:signal transduction histidine kinase
VIPPPVASPVHAAVRDREPACGRVRLGAFGGRAPFAPFAAHELRSPIALQRALVEVTLADPDVDVTALRGMAERVLACCEAQERLIDGLLDLASSGRELRRREPFDIAALAADALRTHDLSGLDSFTALESAWTTGDPALVERLAANLVSNAVRHNLRRGGWVEVATRTESGRAVLSIANGGAAIPAGDVAGLFRPFRRLESTGDSSATGSGLGLAIVHAIAEAHGAFVAARARPGGGLEVDVGFPVERAPC